VSLFSIGYILYKVAHVYSTNQLDTDINEGNFYSKKS